jgi:hypothetical protein
MSSMNVAHAGFAAGDRRSPCATPVPAGSRAAHCSRSCSPPIRHGFALFSGSPPSTESGIRLTTLAPESTERWAEHASIYRMLDEVERLRLVPMRVAEHEIVLHGACKDCAG